MLCFLLYYEKFCLDRQRFPPLSSSLAKDTKKKNKVSAHAAAAKYNLWRPIDTKIHHDLELSHSPHTGVFREHECRTVVGNISTRRPQRQKTTNKKYKKTTSRPRKKTQKTTKEHEKTTKNHNKNDKKHENTQQ